MIVYLSGIIDTGTSPAAEDAINNFLKEGHNKLLINLKEIEYMSSSGLRVLLATAKKIWAMDGKFRICNPNKIVNDILDTSGFSLIMDVVESEEEALKAM